MFDDFRILTEQVVFVSADVDEVISREVLYKLSWCELAEDVVWGGLWMPMGDPRRALKVLLDLENIQICINI